MALSSWSAGRRCLGHPLSPPTPEGPCPWASAFHTIPPRPQVFSVPFLTHVFPVPKGSLPGHAAPHVTKGPPPCHSIPPPLSAPKLSPLWVSRSIHLPQILRAHKSPSPLHTEGLPPCAPKHSPALAPEAPPAQSPRKIHHLSIT